ncbi:MAG: hypothetical protein K1X94_18340 [Sandaracinaceae bacterium]|nr:hypothetical protein [Sandaracinaceae bacterium]
MADETLEAPIVEPALLDAIAAEKAESQRLMISGAAIGALDLVAIAALGVGCPLCAVGAPALIGWGAYRAWKVHKLAREVTEGAAATQSATSKSPA